MYGLEQVDRFEVGLMALELQICMVYSSDISARFDYFSDHTINRKLIILLILQR